jgi:hypothetical protein
MKDKEIAAMTKEELSHLKDFSQPRHIANGNGHSIGEQTTPKVRYCLYLVLNYNDGTRVEPEKLQQLMNEIVVFAEGATHLPPGIGWWIDTLSQKVHKDIVLVIEAVVPNSLEAELFFQKWATEAARLLEQECIFVTHYPVSILKSDVSNHDIFQLEADNELRIDEGATKASRVSSNVV